MGNFIYEPQEYVEINEGTFKLVGTIQNQTLEHINQYQNIKSKQKIEKMLSKVLYFQLSDQSVDIYHNIMKSIANKNDDLLSIYHAKLELPEDQCTNNKQKITVFFQQFESSLAELIKRKISQRQPFTESFIWDTALYLSSAMKRLHQSKIFYEDIKPENIFITKRRELKLNNIVFKNYQERRDRHKNKQTISPAYLRINPTKNQIEYCDVFSGDVYRIGMVLYELALLENPLLYYNFKDRTVDLHQMQMNIRNKEFYSERLRQFIIKLIQEQDRDRPTSEELYRFILSSPQKRSSVRKASDTSSTQQ